MLVTTTMLVMMMATTNKRQVALKYGFRSGLEKDIAEDLKSTGVSFTYEEQKIEYTKPARVSKYTPDYVIDTRPDGTPRNKPLIIEAKGRFLVDDRSKHLLIKRQHPLLDIRFLFNNPNARISKKSKTTYAAWCKKHGFQYAKGPKVPRDWLEED